MLDGGAEKYAGCAKKQVAPHKEKFQLVGISVYLYRFGTTDQSVCLGLERAL